MIKVKKIRGKWRADYILPLTGERRRPLLESVSYNGAIKEAETLFQNELRNGSPAAKRAAAEREEAARPVEKPAVLTFREFVTRTEPPCFADAAVKLAPTTRVQYQYLLDRHLLPHFGEMPLDQISDFEWDRFEAELLRQKNRLGQPLKSRSAGNLLISVLTAAVKQRAIERFAEPRVERDWGQAGIVPDAPSVEVARQIYAACPAMELLMFTLLSGFGLRVSEAIGVERQDISFEGQGHLVVRRSISVDQVVMPKSGKHRILPIPPEALPILREACKDKLPMARLVTLQNGKSPTRGAIRERFYRLQRRIGMTKIWGPHAFRHFYVTNLFNGLVPAHVVQRLAGHSDLKITMRYAHGVMDQLVQAAGSLPRLGGEEK